MGQGSVSLGKAALQVGRQCFMGAGSASGENGTAICTTVYPTISRVFVGLLDLRVRLPHVLACFCGVIVLPVPFTPRFGLFLWGYWTFGSVYPTFSRVFVELLSLPSRLPHDLACFRGIMVLSPVPRIPYSIHVFYYNLIT